ncbi:uncharacterized protein LOC105922039 [Fundulus heteroclitus]|uniref:uncharacterized protein LOC105922039 n=1 Tax=Fundulus heteroclitus TaxID=8078 RepID=UPI00165AB7DD|nr:uncharacterized protein LOC105922039 [Fundulus heteroclitus]
MACRRKTTHLSKQRTGLRSQQQEEASAETAWETQPSTSADEKMEQPQTQPGESGKEIMSLLQNFMEAQQKKEDSLIKVLHDLKRSIQPAVRQPPPRTITSSTGSASSPRYHLPTPASRRPPDSESSSSPSPPTESRQSRSRQRFFWEGHSDPKMLPYAAGEDIEDYLMRFERIAKTWKWPETEWACRLVPLLSETYRQRFRSTMVPPDESPAETYSRLKGLYRRWIRPTQHTKEQIGETIVLEQFLRVLPPEMRTWVKEREPKDGNRAAKLATQFLNARRGGSGANFISRSRRATSQPVQVKATTERGNRDFPGNPSREPDYHQPGKTFVCYYCQQPGHKASVCPVRKAKVTGACYPPRLEEGNIETENISRHYQEITVNGQNVTALLDTGSFMSLIKQSLVPVGHIDYGRQGDILCVHGDKHTYPKADLTVVIDEQPYLLTFGVIENLPVDVIFGRDLPVLFDWLKEKQSTQMGSDKDVETQVNVNISGPVVTRAQAQAGVQPLPDLDSTLCDGGTKGPRKTRSQRRFEKQLRLKEPDKIDSLWDIPENISLLQQEDESLKPLFVKAEREKNGNCVVEPKYLVESDVLYNIENECKRLVIPAKCRPLIMYLAHTLPWAGHLGRHKTYLRTSARFYWPTMYSDIQTYCATCPICQKTSATRKADRALLRPLPVISTPFRRIAMDIVGPLIKSSSGHQYILVVSDYATRFPEAFPLRTISAPLVLRALMQLFSRVGIPDEIITDQGTNFTSKLMQLFYKQLGIAPIKTTPYHPQTDGLVERFNQTLKRMLQKFVDDTGKDWDRWLPFLLFAYREVPQASTGFSPFELLYGWDVQGPLDLLRKRWESPPACKNDKGIIQFVLEMRE